MGDPKPYSRAQTRADLRLWLNERRTLVVALTLIVLALAIFEALMVWWWSPGPLVGMVVGGLVVGFALIACWRVHILFLTQDRKAIHHLRGSEGEDATREVLKRAERAGSVIGAVHSIRLEKTDLDHVVMASRAGLIVMDSKYRTAVDDDDVERMVDNGRRLGTRITALASTTMPRGRGRHRGQAHLPVIPAIVMWGPAQRLVSGNGIVNGVHLVLGDSLEEWLNALEGEPVDPELGREVLESFRQWSAARAAKANAPAGS